jgi:uncharacterized protein YbjT (DUF2867 family)
MIETKKMKLTANVIGATGLVGKQLVNLLLEDQHFEVVRIFVRRNTGLQHPKLEQHIVDFEDEKTWKTALKGDVLFSALGTTLKQAGSKEKQYKIDFTLNYNFAKASKTNGIENYVLVSSIGANSKSTIFYTKIKGELDEAVCKIGFKNLAILRPSSLTGNRKEKRTGEIITIPIATFLTKYVLKNYRPIKDTIVAQAMINAALTPVANKTIWEGVEVFNLSKEK